jgi:hypothetical protein
MNPIAEAAIIESIETDTIVHLDYASDVALDLRNECADSVAHEDVTEFWGVSEYNDEWRDWRVHLYSGPRGDIRLAEEA